MRISDWSSDVCSSDLREHPGGDHGEGRLDEFRGLQRKAGEADPAPRALDFVAQDQRQRKQRQRTEEDRHRQSPYLARSEEHTSELQSLMRISYAVFCLKKKKELQHTHVNNIQH